MNGGQRRFREMGIPTAISSVTVHFAQATVSPGYWSPSRRWRASETTTGSRAFGAHQSDLQDCFDGLANVRVDFSLHLLPTHAPVIEAVANAGGGLISNVLAPFVTRGLLRENVP